MNEMNNRAIIFDLDGTLLDTSLGIFGSVRYAETQMKLNPIDETKLSQFVGPPPKEMYMRCYGLSELEALKAVGFHREYGMERAIYEAKVYDGIIETLIQIHKLGFKVAVATLKKQSLAEKILKIFGLSEYFDTIVGMNEEESFSKKDTIVLAMKNMCVSEAIMVGDSNYDYLGAIEANVGFVGVLYGFGFRKDNAYDFVTVSNPKDIIKIVENYDEWHQS